MIGIRFFLIFSLSLFITGGKIILAAEKEEVTSSFSIDNLDRDKLHFYSKRQGLLNTYMLCLAAARDDQSICDNLSPAESSFCSANFYNLHVFLKSLTFGGGVSSDVISKACAKEKSVGQDECRMFYKAIITKDISLCDKMKSKRIKSECSAMVTQNDSLCADNLCKDQIFYLKAIQRGDINICNKISDQSINALCKADVTGDESVCNQCEDYKRFIKVYYNEEKHRAEEMKKEVMGK